MAIPDVSIQPSPAQLLRWFYEWSHRLRPRRKTRRERLTIYRVRRAVFERSDGLCEMGISPKCLGGITWRTMHTAHIVSRARGGTWEPNNLLAACFECHIGWEHSGGKLCPPKLRCQGWWLASLLLRPYRLPQTCLQFLALCRNQLSSSFLRFPRNR